MKAFWTALVLAFLVAVAPSYAGPNSVSGDAGLPVIVTAQVSPDGKRIAILGGAPGHRFVSIATLDQPDLPVAQLGSAEGLSLIWASNDYLIARVSVVDKPQAGVEYRLTRNIVITTKGEMLTPLLAKDSVSRFLIDQSMIGVVSAGPTRVLVEGLVSSVSPTMNANSAFARAGAAQWFQVALFSVDPLTGAAALADQGDGHTASWAADSTGEPRVRVELDPSSGEFAIMRRAKGGVLWSKLWSGHDLGKGSYYYGYSEPDGAIYAGVGDQLVLKSLADGATKPISARRPAAGLDLIWDHNRNTAVGLKTHDATPDYEWWDAEVGGVHAALSKVFKGKVVDMVSWSDDRMRFVAKVSAQNEPAAWYLFDKARKELSPLGGVVTQP
ncbi:MAG: hypothetical protein JSS35_03230 [Proteobacteria bacterium]|nr:hypothetical protein [Pseudomonadota bacterium]